MSYPFLKSLILTFAIPVPIRPSLYPFPCYLDCDQLFPDSWIRQCSHSCLSLLCSPAFSSASPARGSLPLLSVLLRSFSLCCCTCGAACVLPAVVVSWLLLWRCYLAGDTSSLVLLLMFFCLFFAEAFFLLCSGVLLLLVVFVAVVRCCCYGGGVGSAVACRYQRLTIGYGGCLRY